MFMVKFDDNVCIRFLVSKTSENEKLVSLDFIATYIKQNT